MKEISRVLLLIFIYRILLDIIYSVEISPLFDYFLMVDNSTSESFFISWIALLLYIPFVAWSFKPENDSVTSYATLLFFITRVVPYTSFMHFSPQSAYYLSLNFLYWCLLFTLLRFGKDISLASFRSTSEKPIRIITFIAVFTVLIVSSVYANFRIHLSLDDVYELREEARLFSMPLFLRYLNASTANIIPIVMVYFITQRKKYFVYLLAFIGLLNFSVAGSKSTLFKILLCLLLTYRKDLNIKKFILPGLILLCTLSLIEYYSIHTTALSSIIIRRMFYVPNMLDTLYFSYIYDHSPLYFATEGYKTLSFTIGTEFFGRDAMRANNGLFTDAYVNLGAIGCVVFPFLIATLFRICEQLFNGVDKGIVIFATFLIVTTLGSSMFTTSLLTHGLLFLILTVTLIPKKMKQ